jgi:hypothetical protein
MLNRILLIVIAIAFSASAANAQTNPDYASWARYDLGTTVTTRQTSETAGQVSKMTILRKLVEKTPQKVVIEIELRPDPFNGQTVPPLISKIEVKSQLEPQRGRGARGSNQQVTETQEMITVAGKQYQAKVTETVQKETGQTLTTKTWTHPEFPGLTLKSTQRMDGPVKSETNIEATEATLKPAG